RRSPRPQPPRRRRPQRKRTQAHSGASEGGPPMTVQILAAVLNSLWQAAIVATLVWLSLRFLPRMRIYVNAATRYVIWWAALAVILLLPTAPRILETSHAAAQPISPATAAYLSPPALRSPLIQDAPLIVT